MGVLRWVCSQSGTTGSSPWEPGRQETQPSGEICWMVVSGSESIALSKQHEMRVYVASMRAMYENAVIQNGERYDPHPALCCRPLNQPDEVRAVFGPLHNRVGRAGSDHWRRSAGGTGGSVPTSRKISPRKWTCSIIGDQSAQTQYRNWRKAQQHCRRRTWSFGESEMGSWSWSRPKRWACKWMPSSESRSAVTSPGTG